MLEPAGWTQEIIFRAGLGYHDNILLLDTGERASAYSLAEVEYLGFRLPEPGQGQFHTYLLAQNRHFFQGEAFSDEYLVLAQATYKNTLGDHLLWEATAHYIFNDRVYGLSPLEDEIITTPLRVHQGYHGYALSAALPASVLVRLEGGMERSSFPGTENGYWRPLADIYLERALFGNHELQAGVLASYRDYDDRPQRSASGLAVPGTHLTWTTWEPYLKWTTQWKDGERRLRAALKASYRDNRDNGVGYDDHERLFASLNGAWDNGPWSVTLEGSFSHYNYFNRRVGILDATPYEITQWSARLQISRNLFSSWEVYTEYEFENSDSTRDSDFYRAHRGELGLTASF